jgi:hypothetical protein
MSNMADAARRARGAYSSGVLDHTDNQRAYIEGQTKRKIMISLC